MSASDLRPLSPARSWPLGVQVAAATTLVLGLTLLLEGRRSVTGYALLAISATAAIVAKVAVARGWSPGTSGWLLYAWTGGGLLALTTWMLALGDGPLRYVGVLTIALVASAGSYPRAGAVLMGLVALFSATAAWVAAPGSAPLGHVLAAGFLIVAVLAGAMRATAELTRTLAATEQAGQRAAIRNRLLATTGRTVTLDVRHVGTNILDAVEELGFEMSTLSFIVGGYRLHIATRGLDEERFEPARTSEGLAGRALELGRTVWVDDYTDSDLAIYDDTAIGGAVAVPIDGGDGPTAILVAARAEVGVPPDDDITVLEELGRHAGYALSNAYRYREEQRIVDRLRDLETLKRSLVANVSHDLRTPLASVRGLAETLEVRGAELDDADVRMIHDRIGDNVTRLSDMIHGLLSFHPPLAGSDEGPVELSAVVDACLWRMASLLDDHVVVLDVPPGLAVVTRVSLLDHALENLLSNAAKYTPAGTRVTVSATASGSSVRLSVTDDGPGIAADDVPNLTRQFWRAADVGSLPGTGLGLHVVETMLAESGSALDITSTPGAGAAFSFELPLANRSATA